MHGQGRQYSNPNLLVIISEMKKEQGQQLHQRPKKGIGDNISGLMTKVGEQGGKLVLQA